MENKLTKGSIEEHFVSLEGNGNWIDEEDLELKYKTKPTKLLAIRKNAQQWYDPQSETTLFEDMEFTSSYNNTNTDRTTAKRTFTQTKEKFKGAAKKPKVKKESDEAASLDAEVKPINEKEKSVLENR